MAFGRSMAKANSRVNDVERKLYLSKDAVLVLVRGNRGETKLGELTNGWNLVLNEQIEPQTKKRYYPLFIDDVDGDRLAALKEAVGVRLNGTLYKFYAKPPFMGTIPSYRFKVQEVGPQIAG